MPEETTTAEKIIPRVIEDEMKSSYLAYSMSVIIGRALPDVRDGLKPVHRRVLYGMYDLGVTHNKPFKKSARVVGDVMGKYHPHGDMSIYDSLVRMAQDFSLRYPLINGQGNFGSIDGDAAAAMRYTECRMKKIAEELLQDIDKNTVKMVPNYDGQLKEPSVLPAKIPNLLINGSSGIAVGMATNIPPHNLKEVCSGVIVCIDNPAVTSESLMTQVIAPDFPTGGIICGISGVRDAYATGKGKIVVRAKSEIEEEKGRQKIIINQIPYMVNKSDLISQIAELVRDKKVQGITELRDESDREQQVRIVFELKSGANADVVLNQLFKHSRLQESYGIIMLALVNNEPKVLPLKDILQLFIEHRQDVVRKRVEFDLDEAEKKAHLLEGMIVALDNIDAVIVFLKAAKSTDEARTGLMADYKLSELQAQAILDMKLQKLTPMEQGKIRAEHSLTLGEIKSFKEILASEEKILGIIKSEMLEIIQNYGDERKTLVSQVSIDGVDDESLIKSEDMVVTLTKAGYVKRLPADTYKQQQRGGKGVVGADIKEEDIVENLFVCNTHDSLLFFTKFDFKKYNEFLKKYSLLDYMDRLSGIVRGFFDCNVLGLTPRELKLKKKEIIGRLRKT